MECRCYSGARQQLRRVAVLSVPSSVSRAERPWMSLQTRRPCMLQSMGNVAGQAGGWRLYFMCDASGCPRVRAVWRRFLAIWWFLDRTRRKIGLSLKIRLVSILLPEVE
ncbi:hypothetical protein LI328DRAFT_104393 [Trichoderma asperelloides]|nr:hypothetical protein LI328DRAFT_104393 [Trichoderma asperelloides]